MAAGETWWTHLAESAPLWGAAGIALTQGVNMVLASWQGRQTDRNKDLDVGTESFKLAQGNQQAVVQQLFELVKTLREDVKQLRIELEESENLREAAEANVRELRDEVHALRGEIQHKQNIARRAAPDADPAPAGREP